MSDSISEKEGIYIAFNKAIATEAAQTFPSNVLCKTAHSLAYKAVGHKYAKRLQRLSGGALSEDYLNLKNGIYDFTAAVTGNLVLEILTRFCQSADDEITRDHVSWVALRPIEDKEVKYALADELVFLARKTWSMMIDPKGKIPITHDVYLKLWALSNPIIHKDFILFDEAQDANAVMLGLVCSQDAQKIFVGDRYQQIYSWRGAVNAMQTIDTTHECKISQSFRFGQKVADVANSILNNQLGANVSIKGFDKINSTIGYVDTPDAILCRTNSTLIDTLINRLSLGDTVSVAGGCGDMVSLLKGAKELMSGNRTNQRDLALFETWSEVVEFSESEAGSDLAPTVNLIKNYDIDNLITSLNKANKVRESQADIILSTAHKSKGREWSTVKLADDFRHPDSKGYSEEETNLLYVAATRAIDTLDITECEAAQEALTEKIED